MTFQLLPMAARVASTVELLTGALLCCVLSLAVPVVCLIGALDVENKATGLEQIVPGVLFAVTILLGGQAVFLALGPIFGREAWGPEAALRQPRWPVPLRPILGLYWAAHFLLGAIFASGMKRLGFDLADGKSPGEAVRTLLLIAFAIFGFTYAANFYLLLALSVVTRSERLLRAVWEWRILVDIFLSFAAVLVAFAL